MWHSRASSSKNVEIILLFISIATFLITNMPDTNPGNSNLKIVLKYSSYETPPARSSASSGHSLGGNVGNPPEISGCASNTMAPVARGLAIMFEVQGQGDEDDH